MADQSKIGEAYVELAVKDGDYKAKMASAKGSLESIGGSLLTFKNITLAAAGAALVKFGVTSAMEFGKAEQAELNLASTLKLHGENIGLLMPKLDAFAGLIQKTTTYDDEQIKSVMALGSQLGFEGDQLQQVTKAAIGLSEATGVGLEGSMRMLIRASHGSTQQLSRYGIVVDENASKQDKFNQVLKMGADFFSLAEIRSKGLAGQATKTKNAFGEMKESIGGLLAKAFHLPAFFETLTALFEGLNKIFGKNELTDSQMKALDELRARLKKSNDEFLEGEKEKQKAMMKTMSFAGLWNAIQEAVLGQVGDSSSVAVATAGGPATTMKTPLTQSQVSVSMSPAFKTEEERAIAYNPRFIPGSGANTVSRVKIDAVGQDPVPISIKSITAEAAREIGKGIPFQWSP